MRKTNVPIERPSLYDTMWLINRVMAFVSSCHQGRERTFGHAAD